VKRKKIKDPDKSVPPAGGKKTKEPKTKGKEALEKHVGFGLKLDPLNGLG